MPYIEQDRREAISEGDHPKNSGELNFSLTRALLTVRPWSNETRTALLKICREYIADRAAGEIGGGTRYQHINDVLGALDGMAREYGRRCVMGYPVAQVLRESIAAAIYWEIAAPYEDQKRISNGDISYE